MTAETDNEVLKALDLLPKAQELSEGAKKVVAERSAQSPSLQR